MADHFTHFSCLLDMGSPENAVGALELYDNAAEDDDGFPLSDGFLLSLQEGGGTQLWIRDDECADPERVIQFVLLCAERFDLKGRWGFEWANICSKPRLGAFGGGAHIIDLGARKSIGSIGTNEWLCHALEDNDPNA